MKFNLTHPCPLCPFRKDSPSGWLGKERAAQIAASCPGGDQAFPCHETTGVKAGENVPMREQSQCAGALVLTRKENGSIGSNVSFRIAVLAGWVRPDVVIRGEELIFDSIDEFIKHHT